MNDYPIEVQTILNAGNFAEAKSTFEKIIFARYDAGEIDGLGELIDLCESMKPAHVAPVSRKAPPSGVTPCPPISDITMIQTTIWDNWAGSSKRPETPGGLKKNPFPLHRYGCGVRVWTIDPSSIRTMGQLDKAAAFGGSTRLYPATDMVTVTNNLAAHNKISAPYCDELQTTISNSTGACRFGLFSGDGSLSKGVGKSYIPHQFLRIEIFERGGELIEPDFCDLHIDGETLRIDGWTQFHPIKAGCVPKSISEFASSKGQFPVFTSRLDLSGKYGFLNWHTGSEIV